jgi:hypothetical protein
MEGHGPVENNGAMARLLYRRLRSLANGSTDSAPEKADGYRRILSDEVRQTRAKPLGCEARRTVNSEWLPRRVGQQRRHGDFNGVEGRREVEEQSPAFERKLVASVPTDE